MAHQRRDGNGKNGAVAANATPPNFTVVLRMIM